MLIQKQIIAIERCRLLWKRWTTNLATGQAKEEANLMVVVSCHRGRCARTGVNISPLQIYWNITSLFLHFYAIQRYCEVSNVTKSFRIFWLLFNMYNSEATIMRAMWGLAYLFLRHVANFLVPTRDIDYRETCYAVDIPDTVFQHIFLNCTRKYEDNHVRILHHFHYHAKVAGNVLIIYLKPWSCSDYQKMATIAHAI